MLAEPTTHDLSHSSQPTGSEPTFQPVVTAPAKTANPVARHGDEPDAAVIAQAKKVARLGRMALRACERVFDLEEQVDTRIPQQSFGLDGSRAADAAYKAEIDAVGGVMAYRLDDPIIVAAHQRASTASQSARQPFVEAKRVWDADREALRHQTGVKAAEERQARLDQRLERAGLRLLGMMPRTITGCAAVAAAAKSAADTGLGTETGWTHKLYENIVRAVLKLQKSTASKPAQPDAELLALGARLERLWHEEETIEGDDAVVDAALDRSRAVVDAIMTIKPTTLAGARVKARAVSWGYNNHVSDEEGTGPMLLRRFLTELGALEPVPPGTAGYAPVSNVEAGAIWIAAQAKPDWLVLESYRTWLHQEHRVLTQEMYPGHPYADRAVYLDNPGARFHFRGEAPASSRAERMLASVGIDCRNDRMAGQEYQQEQAA